MGAYLNKLRENLAVAREYANLVGDQEQERYAKQYNLRSTDRSYYLGDSVLILVQEKTRAKVFNQWQGPGVIVKINSPYSYGVEVDGKVHKVHTNNIKKYNERIEQTLVSSCSVLYESDKEYFVRAKT